MIYSESKVGTVERGEQLASPAFVERADEFLRTGGLFTRMRNELLTSELSPEWFRPWVDVEREATEIRYSELARTFHRLNGTGTGAPARSLARAGHRDRPRWR